MYEKDLMMREKKLFFVLNPRSGKEQIKSKLLRIVDIFVKAGYEVTIHATQCPKDAFEVVKKKLKYYDLIVCSGGDGTMDEVVTGMMQNESRVPIGFIPAGSTNDFANSIHIPRDMIKAAEICVGGVVFPCDVGNFNGDYFIYIAAFGIFTDVSYETSQDWKNILGHAAYLLEGIKRLSSIRSYHIEISYQEDCSEEMITIEDDFIFGMITNSTSIGGFKNLAPKDVLLNDGLFEVTLIKMPKNPLELNEIVSNLVNLKSETELTYSIKTSHIEIKSEDEIRWTLDGEYGGSHSELIIRNERKAIEVMVEKEWMNSGVVR